MTIRGFLTIIKQNIRKNVDEDSKVYLKQKRAGDGGSLVQVEYT